MHSLLLFSLSGTLMCTDVILLKSMRNPPDRMSTKYIIKMRSNEQSSFDMQKKNWEGLSFFHVTFHIPHHHTIHLSQNKGGGGNFFIFFWGGSGK